MENESKIIYRKKKILQIGERTSEIQLKSINSLKIKAEGIPQYPAWRVKETKNVKEMLRHGIWNDKSTEIL